MALPLRRHALRAISGSDWNYEYNLKDHLGNVRVTVDESGTVKQRQDYYPFGLTFNSYNQSPKNNYLYNQGFGETTHLGEEGKTFNVERQPELGIDLTKFVLAVARLCAE